MADTGAVFGGEHSGHFYFREFWNADSGMLAALYSLSALGNAPKGTTFSSLISKYRKYYGSGEINTAVSDTQVALERVAKHFAGRGAIDRLDGLTISGDSAVSPSMWWLNVRPSNTEPLLRLNVEADSDALMCSIRDEALGVIRQ